MKTTALLPIALAALCAGPLEAAEPADEIASSRQSVRASA